MAGRLIADGAPVEVCSQYEASVRRQEAERLAHVAARSAQAVAVRGGLDRAPQGTMPLLDQFDDSRRYGTQEARIEHVEIIGSDGQPTDVLTSTEPAAIRMYCANQATYNDLVAVVTITREDGLIVSSMTSDEQGLPGMCLPEHVCLEVKLEPVLLGPGDYFLSPHIYRDHSLPLRADPAADRDRATASWRRSLLNPLLRDDIMDYHDRLYRVRVVRRGRDYNVAMEQPARWRLLPWDGSPPAAGS